MSIDDEHRQSAWPARHHDPTALAALVQADTVMAWDTEGGALTVANTVGHMPWTKPGHDSPIRKHPGPLAYVACFRGGRS